MDLHGQTKGTPLEALTNMASQAEINGTLMYCTLAQIASAQGLEDAAAAFAEAGRQEARHAAFYAMLSGKCTKDFWPLVRGLMAAETNGEKAVQAFAAKFRAAGLTEAAAVMDTFAAEEAHHGVMMRELLQKHRPDLLEDDGKQVFVCGCCGYEHTADPAGEPDDWVCPVCGQPKSAFRPKAAPGGDKKNWFVD